MSNFIPMPEGVPKARLAIFNDDLEGPSAVESERAATHYSYWLAQEARAQERIEIGSYSLAHGLAHRLEEFVAWPDGEMYDGRRCQLMGVLALSTLCQRLWKADATLEDAVGAKNATVVIDAQLIDIVGPSHSPRVHLNHRIMDDVFSPKGALQTTKPLWYEDTLDGEQLYVRRMQRFLPSPEVQISMANRGVHVDPSIMETVFPYIPKE